MTQTAQTMPGVAGEVRASTCSACHPSPGFRPAAGEDDGTCDQHVLREASCATPSGHERRASSGLRLARS